MDGLSMWSGMGGYWYHPGKQQSEQITALLQQCQKAGVKRLFPYYNQGATYIKHCDEQLPSVRRVIDDYYHRQPFDPMEYYVTEAHKLGMEVHPYFAVGVEGGRIPNLMTGRGETEPFCTISPFADAHPEYWVMNREGQTSFDVSSLLYMSFGFPEARQAKVAEWVQIAKDYDVDGLQLEFLLPPKDADGCSVYGYEAPILEEFRRRTGKDAHDVPNNDEAWVRTRCHFVSLLIGELREALQQLDRPVQLTASLVAQPSMEAYLGVMTDWPTWVEHRWFDTIYLWHTHGDMARIDRDTRAFRTQIPDDYPLGIQLASWGADRLNTPQRLREAAKIAWEAGADHIGVYRMDAVQAYQLWDTLPELCSLRPE